MPPDLAKLQAVQRNYEVRMALLPVHDAKTYAVPQDTPRTELISTFPPMGRIDSDRMGEVGEGLIFNGQNSYVRGGGAATGHDWKIYHYNAMTDDNYLTNRGAEVTTGKTLLAGGTALQWVPVDPGMYAIELHLNGDIVGDGQTAPLGFSVRFINVFAPSGYDLDGTPRSSIRASMAEGGASASFRYLQPNQVSTGRQSVEPLQRIVIRRREYWWNGSAFEEYTWDGAAADPTFAANEVAFRGVINGETIQEALTGRGLDFSAAGIQLIASRLRMPVRDLGSFAADSGLPANLPMEDIPPAFVDEDFFQAAFAGSLGPNAPPWIYRIAGMRNSDPLWWIIKRFTNLNDYWDVFLWYATVGSEDRVVSMGTQAGNVWDWWRKIEQDRIGHLYSDRKGNIFGGPDHNIRGDEHWAVNMTPVITFGPDFYRRIDAPRQVPQVGLVVVRSANSVEILSEAIKVGPGAADLQKFVNNMYRGQAVSATASGQKVRYEAKAFYSQERVNVIAARLLARDNGEYPSIRVVCPMLGGIDLNQTVAVILDPDTDEPSATWPSPGKLFLVDAYDHEYDTLFGHWQTVLTLREITVS